jgi:pimeloyl-ACP methyl ester carboxylesterase
LGVWLKRLLLETTSWSTAGNPSAYPIDISFQVAGRRWQVQEETFVKATFLENELGTMAYRVSSGAGPTVVLVHGNSGSARSFARQLEGPIGERLRLVAIDLPGHGESQDAANPAAYSLPGYARAVAALVKALGLEEAVFVGWSLGGHVLLEAAPDLPKAAGFMIFGTPPLAFPPAMAEAFLPNPAFGVGFSAEVSKEQAEAFVASFFRPGYADVAPAFLDDVMRTDGRARAHLGASIAPNGYRDEVAVVANLKRPLAIVHGAKEQLVNGAYFDSLTMPTLWRGAVQTIPDAGHAPQWEQAPAFDALLEAFVADTR